MNIEAPTQLRARSQDAITHVTVIGGAGHVGLPLSLAFAAKGLDVTVMDLNRRALDTIAAGKLPAIEYGAEPLLEKALAENRLTLTANLADLPRKGAVIVTIGTPVDEFHNPVYRAIRQCIDDLLPHMDDGQLLVLRSTVFPGTTEWLQRYVREKGRDLLVAFCPERVVQGFAIRELEGMPQIVSGTTDEAEQAARGLFEVIAPSTVTVKPIEAEFAKLFTNAYRYIQFATTNQFYMIAKRAGADYDRIVDAMTRDYPRTKGFPTAGFAAGPCLFKDTMQLAAFAQNGFGLGHAAMLVNEGLCMHVVDELKTQFDLSGITVGLLGMAFKADVDDTRSSLSYKLKKMLLLQARRVLTTDPLVTDDASLLPLDEVIAQSDVLVLCTPHSTYRGLDLRGKPVVDVWSFLPGGT